MRRFRLVLRWVWLQILDLYLTDRRLFLRLRAVTQREQIAVLPMQPEEHGDRRTLGKYLREFRQIQLDGKHRFDPWVLAHEIGHHVALLRGDGSETAADHEGNRALRSVLNETEARAVAWRMDTMLPLDPSVNAKRIAQRADKIRQLAARTSENEAAVAIARLAEMQAAEHHARLTLARSERHSALARYDQERMRRQPPLTTMMGFTAGSVVNLVNSHFVAAGVFFAVVLFLGMFSRKIWHHALLILDRRRYGSRCFGVGDSCTKGCP